MRMFKYRHGSQRRGKSKDFDLREMDQTLGTITFWCEAEKMYYIIVLDSVTEGRKLQSRVQRAYGELEDVQQNS